MKFCKVPSISEWMSLGANIRHQRQICPCHLFRWKKTSYHHLHGQLLFRETVALFYLSVQLSPIPAPRPHSFPWTFIAGLYFCLGQQAELPPPTQAVGELATWSSLHV